MQVDQPEPPRKLGLHHLAIKAADVETSLRCYSEGLGCHAALRFQADGAAFAFLASGDGSYLELFEAGGGEIVSGPLIHFALRADDCDAALARARAASALVTIEPTDVVLRGERPVTVRYAFCLGPDGEEIEFLQSSDI